MAQQPKQANIAIGVKRGRSTLVSSALNTKLRTMMQNMKISDASINIRTVGGEARAVSGLPSYKNMGGITL